MTFTLQSIRIPATDETAELEGGGIYATVCPDMTSNPPSVRGLSMRPAAMHGVVGVSDELKEVYSLVDRIADTACTVLVTGESGTGKELVARALHGASPRRDKPFVAVNCGAIPEALLESELFGHVRGAFTGAHANKPGRVATAEGGTLFLDEIGELPLSLQVKLLRLLQAREYSPVGDHKTHRADVRIVAATNIDLEVASAEGKFREDLYYRLNVIHLHVPPLRSRPEDVPALATHFLARSRTKTGRTAVIGVSRAALEILVAWNWPGNVRELENTMERAVLLCHGDRIEPRDLPPRLLRAGADAQQGTRLPDGGMDLRAAVERYENELIRQALERTGWNKNQAARLLGLNRTTLVEMIKRKRLPGKVA